MSEEKRPFFRLYGNLVTDPKLEEYKPGKYVATTSIGYTDVWKDQDTQERRERRHFYELRAYGEVAKELAKGSKGQIVEVEGFPKQDKWNSKTALQQVSKIVFEASKVTLGAIKTRETTAPDNERVDASPELF